MGAQAMDERVVQAMQKWPSVPHCWGWLALDARGQWWLRDEQCQAQGTFPQVKGSKLEHEGLKSFIARNYQCDELGQWYFQNGPQRVYVQLECAPYVWHLQALSDGGFDVHSHTGQKARVERVFVDELGKGYLLTDLGFGVVHSLDMMALAAALEDQIWACSEVQSEVLPQMHGFVLNPQHKSSM